MTTPIEARLTESELQKYLPDPFFYDMPGASTFEDSQGIERYDLGGAPVDPYEAINIAASDKAYALGVVEGRKQIVKFIEHWGGKLSDHEFFEMYGFFPQRRNGVLEYIDCLLDDLKKWLGAQSG